MIIKKFIGKTEEEAVALAKAELGENVVIMNVKNTKKKGFFSFFRKNQVEITVAKEEESEKYPTGEKEASAIKETLKQVEKVAQAGMVSETAARRVKEKTEPVKQTVKQDAIEEKLDSLKDMIEKQMVKPEDEKEIKSEKVPEKGEKLKTEDNSEMIRFMKLLYNTMIDNEVNEKYANQMIDEAFKNAKPDMPFDYALANVYQKMILKFGKSSQIEPAEHGPKVVFFIGPTGVGKTTTIAKIGSKFSVEEKKKVALVTADTYRIAAAEQLRTYANILEDPFRIIYSVEEIEAALKDFRNFDYILVDTAGHSHQNKAQGDAMNAFIHSVDGLAEKEVYLVLSATTKYRDLLSIADTYSEMTDYKLIFTKLDETTTLGNLLNLKLHTGASLSYVTLGQNVPDDIEPFNPQKTVKLLLGGKL